MSELDYFTALLLGVIQGLTEFLPISSSGHLALTQRWLNLDPDDPQMLLFDVLAHLGTLIAVLVVFGEQVKRFIARLVYESRRSGSGGRFAWRIVLLAAVAVVPTAGAGLALRDVFEAAFDKPAVIGFCLIATGCFLALLMKWPRGRRGWKHFRWWEAALVGAAQALAILPGISRSGATICMAAFCGWHRRWAAEFSFLIAVPAVIGGTVLTVKDAIDPAVEPFAVATWGPVLVGGITSLAVGIVALKLLLRTVRRAKLHYFAPYCWLVGALVLAFAPSP